MSFATSGVSLIGGMALAAIYALGEYLTTPWIDIATMIPTHGLLNAFGFATLGLLAWRMEDRQCSREHDAFLKASETRTLASSATESQRRKIRSTLPRSTCVPKSTACVFAPAAVDDEPLGQHLGQNPLVHRELRQGELQLVHVAVVADLLGPRHRFQPGGQVVLDERRRVASTTSARWSRRSGKIQA